MYRSQAVTVFDFNFFHATPAFSVLPKPDDGEPYKGHERMRVSRSSISWRSFLSGSFLENWQVFRLSNSMLLLRLSETFSVALRGQETKALSYSRFEGFVILTPMFSSKLCTHKTATRCCARNHTDFSEYVHVFLVVAGERFEPNIDDVWPFSTL